MIKMWKIRNQASFGFGVLDFRDFSFLCFVSDFWCAGKNRQGVVNESFSAARIELISPSLLFHTKMSAFCP
jgi:hypothetical protein